MNPNITGIELIPNQPFVFTPNDPNCLGNDNRDYCVLVDRCDPIQIQQKIRPCSINILCEQFLGSELVTDGDFSEGDTHWNEAGNNWNILSGIACYSVKDGNGVLYQTIAGLSEGTTYRLQFTISNYESGNLGATLWDTAATPVDANGTYVQYITIAPGHVAETLLFVEDISWGGCIDDISLKEVFCYELPPSWIIGESTICHTPGSTDSFEATIIIPSSTSDCLYELVVTISGMTTGTLTPSIGSDLFPAIEANGVYTLYTYSQGGAAFKFTPSLGFDGCIELAPALKSQCNFPILALFDLDDNLIFELTPESDGGVTVYKDDNYITWSFRLCQMEHSVGYGCYKFKLYDQCNPCFEDANELDNSDFSNDLSSWSEGGAWVWDAGNGGQAKITAGTGFVEQNTGVLKLRCVQYVVHSVTGTLHLVLINSVLAQEVTSLNITAPGVYSLCGIADTVGFTALNASGEVGSVYSVNIDSCEECSSRCFQLESNCFSYLEHHECTKFIEAWCEENSLGFNFDVTPYGANFRLRERFRVVNFNPTFPGKKNIQKNSAGRKKLVYGEKEETFQMRFDYVDAIAHRAIESMIYCDNFEVNHGEINAYPTDYDLVKEYIVLTEDYEPEWERLGKQKLSQSQIEIQEIDSGRFNLNLG